MTIKIETYKGLAIGIVYENSKPRKKYLTSDEDLTIILPFVVICINWSRVYKPLSKI